MKYAALAQQLAKQVHVPEHVTKSCKMLFNFLNVVTPRLRPKLFAPDIHGFITVSSRFNNTLATATIAASPSVIPADCSKALA